MKRLITLLLLSSQALFQSLPGLSSDFPGDSQVWLTVFYSPHPAAQPEMSSRFLEAPEIDKARIYDDFQDKLWNFKDALGQEAGRIRAGWQQSLEKFPVIPTTAAPGLPSLETRQRIEQIAQKLRQEASSTLPSQPATRLIQTRDPYFAPRAKVLMESFQAAQVPAGYRAEARELGVRMVRYADATFAESPSDSFALLDVARSALDLMLGIAPIVSVGKDIIDLLAERNPITGEAYTRTDRFFAALGVVTLGGSHLVHTPVKALQRFAKFMGRVDVPDILEAAEKASIRLGEDILHDLRSGRISENAYEYIARNAHSPDAVQYTTKEFREIALRYTSIESQAVFVSPKALHGFETRVVARHIQVGDKIIENAAGDVFRIHPGMIKAEGRYSLGGSFGEGAIYSVRGGGSEALEVAKREADIKSDIVWAERSFSSGRVLDLTDPVVRKQLGVTLDELRMREDYRVTQILGGIARKAGYERILAPGTLNTSFDNIISLENF